MNPKGTILFCEDVHRPPFSTIYRSKPGRSASTSWRVRVAAARRRAGQKYAPRSQPQVLRQTRRRRRQVLCDTGPDAVKHRSGVVNDAQLQRHQGPAGSQG